MQIPVQITFRDFDHSDFIEANVRKCAARLERFHDRITSCHVTLEMPHRRHHQGNIFRVRVDVTAPGSDLSVAREQGVDHAHHEDVYATIREAFHAAGRKLEESLNRHRSERRI
jgi:ribosomal subunit interface protein